MTTRVLVTGAAGYTGSIACEHLLDAGYQVIALDNLMYGQTSLFHLCADPRFDFEVGDTRDEQLIRRLLKSADVVIPLAGIVGAPACDRNPLLAETVNVEAVRLINRLRSHDQLVIYPNTNSGYGVGSGETLCTEETPMKPISLYGRTKVQAERAAGRPQCDCVAAGHCLWDVASNAPGPAGQLLYLRGTDPRLSPNI